MSDLHTIRDRLIAVIKQCSFSKNQSMMSLDSPTSAEPKTDLPLKLMLENLIHNVGYHEVPDSSLLPLKQAIDRATAKEDHSDVPILKFLLKTILLLDSFTNMDVELDADNIQAIKTNLTTLFATLNTLSVKNITNFSVYDGFNLRGFLDTDVTDDTGKYSSIGEQIYVQLKPIINIASTDPDDIPDRVNAFIESYQKKIEPQLLRLENCRLTLKVERLTAEIKQIQSEHLRSTESAASEKETLLATIEKLTTENTALTILSNQSINNSYYFPIFGTRACFWKSGPLSQAPRALVVNHAESNLIRQTFDSTISEPRTSGSSCE